MKIMELRSIVCGILVSACLLASPISLAQTLEGQVLEKDNQEPIPFVNVWVDGSNTGTSTDIDGNFILELDSACTVHFSAIGYHPVSKRYNPAARAPWMVAMEYKTFKLKQVSIHPDDSYAHSIYRKALKQREANKEKINTGCTREKQDQSTLFMALDSLHYLSRFAQRAGTQPYTDAQSGLQFFPVYLRTRHSQMVKANTDQNDSLIHEEVEGILPGLNAQIESMVLGKMAIDFNFYENNIRLLDKNFKSPLHKHALLYYNVYLNDSAYHQGKTFYRFSFYPKNKRAPLFIGHLWIEDSSYMLKAVEARLTPGANLNFIDQLHIRVDYAQSQSGTWYEASQKLLSRFTLTNPKKEEDVNMLPESGQLMIQRTQKYKVQNEQVIPVSFTAKQDAPAYDIDSIARHAARDLRIMQQRPGARLANHMSNMLLTGYLKLNYVEIGPTFDLLSANKIEGHRFTLPLRTGQAISKQFTLGGFLGYGSRNKQFQYGLHAHYRVPIKRRLILSLSYANDYVNSKQSVYTQFIKENPYSKGNGNLVSAFTSKELNPYVHKRVGVEGKLQMDLSSNVELFINPYYHRNLPSEYMPFRKGTFAYPEFRNTGALINIRLSFDQDYDDLPFARIHYGNAHPVLNFSLDLGKSTLPASDLNPQSGMYWRSHVSVKHRINMGMPYLRYMINVGYMQGDLPYTLLEKPYGTNSLGYSRYDYNLLHHGAFAHNAYTNIHLNLNGGGILFNRLPLIKRLNLREMVSLKCYYGFKTAEAKDLFDVPGNLEHKMQQPYAELGLGVSNIFKGLRIEYVRGISEPVKGLRVNAKHGIRMRFEVSF